jgi:hypothetical protein
MLLVDPNPELMVFENEPTPGKSGVFVKKSSGYFCFKNDQVIFGVESSYGYTAIYRDHHRAFAVKTLS